MFCTKCEYYKQYFEYFLNVDFLFGLIFMFYDFIFLFYFCY